jgi:predicted small lipoprotein YifL
MHQSNTIRAVILLLLALLMQGCGRKAALFLPPPPIKPAAEAKVPIEPPLPATSQVAPAQSIQTVPSIQIQPETKK